MFPEAAVAKIAQRIAAAERRREALAERLRAENARAGFFLPVSALPPDGRVAGVDGGLVKKSFHGFDLLLVRAAAVCFRYQKGRIAGVEYWPSRFPAAQPELSDDALETDWMLFSSLRRLRAEAGAALAALEAFHPDVLLLHGPVVPHYADKPAKSSPVYEAYQETIGLYRQLFEQAGQTLLAGVVEDSRGTLACEWLLELLPGLAPHLQETLRASRDTTVLHHALAHGERTGLIPYTRAPAAHPVLRDLPGVGEKLHSFFLKLAPHDRPVRVDFFRQRPAEDELAGMLLAIAGSHGGYGMPAPLIEADNVARLPDTALEMLEGRIAAAAGPAQFRLRREQRPF